MIGQMTSQVPQQVGRDSGARRTARMWVMLCLALSVLIWGPAPVAAASHGNDTPPQQGHSSQRLYDRQAGGIWISDDAGVTWTPAGALPSRALSLAVAQGTPGLVFVGTESLGLLRSNDGGDSWQPVVSAVLGLDQGAPVAVTALAIDLEDEQIVYAAINIWLGTTIAHLTPLGIAVSVDGGRQWLQLSRAQPGDAPVQRLAPVAGQPLAVVAFNSAGSRTVRLALSPELLGLLHDSNPAIRASAARAIGLIGDAAALPGLLQGLADPDALAGQRIAEAIGSIGDRSANAALSNMLRSAPMAERARAALTLGLLHAPEAVPGLAALLREGDPAAQRVAAEALAAIDTPAAMTALIAPLADLQMTSTRHAAMGGLEKAGQRAVAPLVVALLDGSSVVRANAAEMLGWLQPIENPGQRADAEGGLARLLSDPDPAVQTGAAWALGEMDTEPARLALLRLAPGPVLNSAPALAPAASEPIASGPIASGPIVSGPQVVLPGAIAAVAADRKITAALAILSALVLLAALAIVLISKGPRPTSHPRPI